MFDPCSPTASRTVSSRSQHADRTIRGQAIGARERFDHLSLINRTRSQAQSFHNLGEHRRDVPGIVVAAVMRPSSFSPACAMACGSPTSAGSEREIAKSVFLHAAIAPPRSLSAHRESPRSRPEQRLGPRQPWGRIEGKGAPTVPSPNYWAVFFASARTTAGTASPSRRSPVRPSQTIVPPL